MYTYIHMHIYALTYIQISTYLSSSDLDSKITDLSLPVLFMVLSLLARDLCLFDIIIIIITIIIICL